MMASHRVATAKPDYLWTGLGVSIGAAIGLIVGLLGWGGSGIALGISIGAGIGVALGASLDAGVHQSPSGRASTTPGVNGHEESPPVAK